MYSKILVPADGSAPSMLGLQQAIKLARSCGASLRLVHVVNEFILTDAAYVPPVHYEHLIGPLREMGKRILAHAAATVHQQRLESQTELLEMVEGCVADLIVMGTHGRRGLSRLALGSDADGTANLACAGASGPRQA